MCCAATGLTERKETRAKTELDTAQKDIARELGAKLASLKGIAWIGVAICAGDLALMVLPTLIVGNELWILGGGASAVALWFLAHRHGRFQGFVDANQDGIDDRRQ